MGGHNAGEKASQLSVEVFKNFFTEKYYHSPQEALYEAARTANRVVYETSQKYAEFSGMGTTLVATLIRENAVFYVHIGDSRLYYYEQETQTLHRLTKDHSFVQELVDRGIISEAEAEHHPRKNEIKRAIGVQPDVEPEVCQYPLQPADNDFMLLCSDGLNSMISDEQIKKIITDKSLKIIQKAQKLIEAAKNAGGYDNITVQLLRFYGQNRSKAVLPQQNTQKSIGTDKNSNTKTFRTKNRLFAYSLIGLVVIALGAYLLFNSFSKQKANDTKTDTTTHSKSVEEKILPPQEEKQTPKPATTKKELKEKQEKSTAQDSATKKATSPKEMPKKNEKNEKKEKK